MPFELGIAAAVSLQGDARHEWRILERVPHRVSHSLSDVAGYDASIHGGTVRGTIDVLLDIFDNVRDPPLSETEELLRVYRGLRDFRSSLPRNCYTGECVPAPGRRRQRPGRQQHPVRLRWL
jgi:hypothetical protein